MNAKSSTQMSKAAQSILNGDRATSRQFLQSELTEANQTVDSWLLQAWSCDTLSETEEALYRVLELDAENSVALTGLDWLSGLQEVAVELAPGVNSDEEAVAEAEVADEVVAEEEVADEVVAEEEAADEVVAEEEAADEVVAEEESADEVVAEEEPADEVVAEEEAADEVVAEEVANEVVAEEEPANEVVAEEEAG